MKVKLLNNVIPKEINNKIINELINSHWFIAWDVKINRYEKIFSNKNSGFSIETIKDGQVQVHSVLNLYGEIIFNIIIEKLKIKAKLDRLFWNMYLKDSEGDFHTDKKDTNFISVVYNLHNTDGGTEIDGKFYKDLEGQAKIFNSNILHKGFGPKQDNVRFNLNLIFKKCY